jgi:imidazoleglycerol-phosphate dehydratase
MSLPDKSYYIRKTVPPELLYGHFVFFSDGEDNTIRPSEVAGRIKRELEARDQEDSATPVLPASTSLGVDGSNKPLLPSQANTPMPRTATIRRETGETRIQLSLDLDGTGKADIATGVGFFDHMLTLLAKHSLIDLTVKAEGDLHVDAHHTVEDTGICLGQALAEALGDKAGIRRYGSATVPMDEVLVTAAVDLSGRPFCVWLAEVPRETLGTFNAPLAEEFWRAVSAHGSLNLHVLCHHGRNTHHIVEGIFKALARALRQAVEADPRMVGIPSTKGVL